MQTLEDKIDKIKQRINNGKIFQSDIEEIMSDLEISEEEYNYIIEEFFSKGIEIVEDEEFISENPSEIKEELIIEEDEEYDSYSVDMIKQYFNEISQYEYLTYERELELLKRMKEGDTEAEEILVTSNLRLVAKIAMEYAKSGFYFLDLVQDGTIGLIKSIKKFNIESGYRLATYATWWIKKEIMDSLKEKINLIKIPNYILLTYHKISLAEKKIVSRTGKKAKLEEIANELKMKEEEVAKIKNIVETKPVSLGDTNFDDNDTEMEIEDNKTEEEIDREIYETNRNLKLNNLLKKLDSREKKIIAMYFGFNEGEKYTFKEIGEKLNLSSERVRVIKERALRKLRFAGKEFWEE